MKKNTDIKQDWLEFKYSNFGDTNDLSFVNLRSSEISEVIQCINDKNQIDKKWCIIIMKNGRKYTVYMSYDKVIELI